MNTVPSDVINHLAHIEAGSRLDALRDERPAAKEQTQKAFLALFVPDMPMGVSRTERLALAVYVCLLHNAGEMGQFYKRLLEDVGASEEFIASLVANAAHNTVRGPYGIYPPGPLTSENVPGPIYTPPDKGAGTLGPRLVAALAHAFMLTVHPRDADKASLEALLAAGWDADSIVTLSQLATYLAYQIRLVHGLKAMQDAGCGNENH